MHVLFLEIVNVLRHRNIGLCSPADYRYGLNAPLFNLVGLYNWASHNLASFCANVFL